MKKSLFAIILSLSILNGNNLDSLVQSAIDKNFELKSIEKSILIANENIKLAKKLANPILTLGANDIHTNDIKSRDKEPMQGQFIGFSQVIPITNKLEIKESINITNKNILSLDLEDKKLLLKSKIYELVYKISILKQKQRLVLEQKNNLSKLDKVQNILYTTSKMNVNKIYNTKILTTNLDIALNTLETNINILKLKLEQITYTKIPNEDYQIGIKKTILNMDTTNHPKIKAFEQKLIKNKQTESYEKVSKTSDIKVSATYFNRDKKYQDYVNISVAIPLSIYNRENINIRKAQLEYLKTKDNLETLKTTFKINKQILQNELNNSFNNYTIINEKIISFQKSIEENLNITNTFKQNTQQIINNLNRTIKFKIDALNEKQKYLTALAKSKYYEGN